MSKHESPPFRMVIEAGRLVPASAYDAERLDSYRRGTRVNVRFTEDRDRILVRKWWAVLGLVVKQCDTPWKTKDEASEAIKLALGIVNLSKTIHGAFMQYPKSLVDLTDPELQEAVDHMMALIERITGVDPETLRKEIGDLGAEDEPHDPETGELIEHDSGAFPSPDADGPPPTAEAGESSPPASNPSEWLPTVARMLWAATHTTGNVDANLELLNNQRIACAALPGEPTEAEKLKAGSIYRVCKDLISSAINREYAIKLISGHAGCEIGGSNG